MNIMNGSIRHELKYLINYHEYTYLKTRLEATLDRDENAAADGNYHVRSLYFDDVYNSALTEKEQGVLKRKKYRIRTYNLDDSVIRLERKDKYSYYISKTSKNLTREEFYRILGNDCQWLLDSNHSLFLDFYIQIRDKLLRPVVIVDYEREAYTYGAGSVRITFDKNLRAGTNSLDIFDGAVATKTVLGRPVMVMEVKYDSFLPTHIRNLIQICSHNISAASKYVMGVKAVNEIK